MPKQAEYTWSSKKILDNIECLAEDVAEFKELNKHGVHLIHQMVPADSAEDFMELLNKKG